MCPRPAGGRGIPEARLHLLDAFALQAAGTTVEMPEGLQRLLAFLAQHGPSPRAVVAGTLWPEVPESHALASLRTGVWRLNKVMPGLVCADAGTTVVRTSAAAAIAIRHLTSHAP